MIFLKIYDAKEEEWEFTNNYVSIVPDYLKWREWAVDKQAHFWYQYHSAQESNDGTGVEIHDSKCV